jgi:DNA-binding CsgD family transcriptional regulator
MNSNRVGRTLASGVAIVAAFNTLAAVSLPVPDRRPALLTTMLWLALLISHATLYWFGDRVRARFGLRAYVAAQAAMIFTLGVAGALFPVGLALLMAFTAEVIVLAGARWGTVQITLGAILLYVANSLIAQDLYRAATAGLLLAITGVVAHAIAALVRRESPAAASEVAPVVENGASPNAMSAEVQSTDSAELTPREAEVLKALVSGARSAQIAAQLGITERTVKSHLANIYQKLGVDSRSAAVALAMQRRLV